jgi:hypothetical protein
VQPDLNAHLSWLQTDLLTPFAPHTTAFHEKAQTRAELGTTTADLEATKQALATSKMTRAKFLSYLVDEIGSDNVTDAIDRMNMGGMPA